MSALTKNYNRRKIAFKKGRGSFLYSKNGKKYLNLTMMVQNRSSYGNNVWVTQTQSKEERKTLKPITLGNAAVKWLDEGGIELAERNEVTNQMQNEQREEIDLPF